MSAAPSNPRIVELPLALGAAALALSASLQHPLWPVPLSVGLAAWIAVAWRWPRAWLFAVPAALPALDFSPWTGWVGIGEFDLLLLGVVAAGYVSRSSDASAPELSAPARAALVALWLMAVLGLWRGVDDAGGWRFGWYQGHADPLNAVRVGKTLIELLLLWPLLRRAAAEDPQRSFALFARGMTAGAALMTAAVLWERAALPGLTNIDSPYRTVALFWEMHVGGAAIDAYVVLATPFVAWSVSAARTRWQWALSAALALLWGYACLTTFARGAYLGIALGLLTLGLLLPAQGAARRWRHVAQAAAAGIGAVLLFGTVLYEWGAIAAAAALLAVGVLLWWRWHRDEVRPGRRRIALALLLLAVSFEAVLIFGPDSFMNRRAAEGARDYQSRRQHWARGVALLDTPARWLFGLGSGRLPAHYDQRAPGGEFPGRVHWVDDGGRGGHVVIAGPRSNDALRGLYGLTQRVPVEPSYSVRLRARSAAPARLLLRVCESHLLYVSGCQWATLAVPAARDGEWQPPQRTFRGRPLTAGPWFAPRQAVLTVSALEAGSRIEVDDIELLGTGPRSLLRNGDFAQGLAGWLPAAQSYFLPWHIDNLYLELLIERGALGAVPVLALLLLALRRAMQGARDGAAAAPFIAASLAGILALGLFSSVQDAPRVALLTGLVACLAFARVK